MLLYFDKKTRKELYKEAGKFFLDIAKLVFAGVILAGIMDLNVDKYLLLAIGSVSVLLLAIAGFLLLFCGYSRKGESVYPPKSHKQKH